MTIDYTNLITSEHASQPNYNATVSLTTQPFSALKDLYNSIPTIYDIDTAVGNQLDVLGQWIGRSRRIALPLTGVYFTWRDTVLTGWRSGVWKGLYDPTSGLVNLPDDSYRKLLKTKIVANYWDGSIPGAYTAWGTIFPASSVIIQDNQNMSMTIGITGQSLSAVDQQLLIGGYIPLRPEGVRIAYYAIAPSATAKIFSWRTPESAALGGWRSGSWPNKLFPV